MSFERTFGKGLKAYCNGDQTPHRIHRDDGYVDTASFDAYFSEYKDWPQYEKDALREVRGAVLDIGCGAGRHALWLQQRGFRVTAIDISPEAIEVAIMRGVRDCKVMSGLQLSFDKTSFDTVLLLGNNFGIAGNPEATKKMLQDIHRITTLEGRIIASSRDPAVTDNPAHLRYHELNRKRGRSIGQVTIRIEYKRELGDWFDLLLVSPSDMSRISEAAGWKMTRLFRENAGYAAILSKL